jgi:hypothetical protein
VDEADLGKIRVKKATQAPLAALIVGQQVAPGRVVAERRRERAGKGGDLAAICLADAAGGIRGYAP